jgi:hypothetical protein
MPFPSAGAGVGADTIQTLNATGTVAAWGSVVLIGTTNPTANITITLPTCPGNNGKSIKFIRCDNTSFTVSILFNGVGTITTTNNLVELKSVGACVELECITDTTVRQVASAPQIVAAEHGSYAPPATTVTNNTGAQAIGTSFILPTAGTYEIMLRGGTTSGTVGVTSNILLKNLATNSFELICPLASENVANTLEGGGCSFKHVTISGPTTFQIYVQVNGGASATTLASDDYQQTAVLATWKKLSGLLPVNGMQGHLFSAGRVNAGWDASGGVTVTAVIDASPTYSGGNSVNFLDFTQITENANTGIFTRTATGLTVSQDGYYEVLINSDVHTSTSCATATQLRIGGVPVAFAGYAEHTTLGNVQGQLTLAWAGFITAGQAIQLLPFRNGNFPGSDTYIHFRCTVKQIGQVPVVATKALVIANKPTNQVIPNGTSTTLTNWNVSKDTMGAMNASTGVFTAPKTGDYEVAFIVGWPPITTSSASYFSADIRVDGSIVRGNYHQVNVGTTTDFSVQVVSVISLTVGQQVTLCVTQSSGGSQGTSPTTYRTMVTIRET